MKCYLSYNYTVTLEYPPYSRLNIKYEYLRDGTIRPFNSNLCFRANHDNTTLTSCNANSQKFIRNPQTAQFIELKTRKYLQALESRLILGHCHDRRPSQRWQFEFVNPDLKNLTEGSAVEKLVSLSLTKEQPAGQSANQPTEKTNQGLSTVTAPVVTTTEASHYSIPKSEYMLINDTFQRIMTDLNALRRYANNTHVVHSTKIAALNETHDSNLNKIQSIGAQIIQLRTILGRISEPEIEKIWKEIEKLKTDTTNLSSLHTLTYEVFELQRHVFPDRSQFKGTNIIELPDNIKRLVTSMHNQYKQELLTEQENKLAAEIRQVYCQVSALERNQAIIMAQGNGLLAAAALDLPACSRLQGFGQTLLLEQCKEQQNINITAVETSCGFQPNFLYNGKNSTIGIDGWSIHPYSDCFWRSHIVNFNGKPHMWIHDNGTGDWIEQHPNLHSTTLELIAEFSEVPLNDYDFTLQAHPAHEASDLEQLNVLNDLLGRIQETSSNSFSTVAVTESQRNNIHHVFSWVDNLKIMVLCVIGFIFFLIFICLFIALNPFPKIIEQRKERKNNKPKKNKYQVNEVELKSREPMLHKTEVAPVNNKPNAPSIDTVHSHNHCTYVVGKGLVWEDLCPCDAE